MKLVLSVLALLALPACALPRSGVIASQDTTCPAGGYVLSLFHDNNGNDVLDAGESVYDRTQICSGVNGKSTSIYVTPATPQDCPGGTGGYAIVTQSPDGYVAVCNGTKGLDGAPGTLVSTVKFCASDNSAFPEWGLLIGSDLFAVYWGPQPFSNGASTAFLAKLTPGSYRSTGGNGCQFTLNQNLTVSN